MFYIQNKENVSYADETTLYAVSDNRDGLMSALQKSSKDLFKWFDGNPIKSNPDK